MDIFGIKKQRELKKQEDAADDNLRRLIELAKNGDLKAGAELSGRRYDAHAYKLGLSEDLISARQEINFAYDLARIRPYFEDWQREAKAGNIETAAGHYSNLKSWEITLSESSLNKLKGLGIDIPAAETRFLAQVKERYAELVLTAAQSAQGFKATRAFIEMMNYQRYRIADLSYPEGWNDLVATFIDRPTIKDFVNLKSYERNRTYWLYAAGEALADEDITRAVIKAKKVIAVYNDNQRLVSNALSLLVRELVTMVAKQRTRA